MGGRGRARGKRESVSQLVIRDGVSCIMDSLYTLTASKNDLQYPTILYHCKYFHFPTANICGASEQ